MEQGFIPDSWLGLIIQARFQVNFAELPFDTAWRQLKRELEEIKEDQAAQDGMFLNL